MFCNALQSWQAEVVSQRRTLNVTAMMAAYNASRNQVLGKRTKKLEITVAQSAEEIKTLECGMEKVKDSMDKMRNLIRQQEIQLKLVTEAKLRYDFFVDSFFGALSALFANSFLVTYPISAIAAVVVRNPQRRKWSERALKTLICFYVFKRISVIAKARGIHNNVGTLHKYGETVWTLLLLRLAGDAKKSDGDSPEESR